MVKVPTMSVLMMMMMMMMIVVFLATAAVRVVWVIKKCHQKKH